MLRELGEQYSEILERHREVLRATWSQSGGTEVSTDGDACFVAFSSARERYAAACRRSPRSSTRSGPAPPGRSCGWASTAGVAFPRDGDYVALAVHQAARVVTTAHGGQVVLSEDTMRTLASERAAEVVPLVDLGRYRLRDFDAPVCAVPGRVDRHVPSGPRRSCRPPQHRGVAHVVRRARGRRRRPSPAPDRRAPRHGRRARGASGSRASRRSSACIIADDWNDGVWLVDLSVVSDEVQVRPGVAAALGIGTSTDDADYDLAAALRERQLLLVLDGCDRVLDAGGRRSPRSCCGRVRESPSWRPARSRSISRPRRCTD